MADDDTERRAPTQAEREWNASADIVRYIQDLKDDRHDCSLEVMHWFLFELLKLDAEEVDKLFGQAVGEWDK